MSNACVVLTTVGVVEKAEHLAKSLVERRLAACVNIVGPIRSIYRWQGAIEDQQEYLLLIKTTKERALDLEVAFAELHPYELPEFLVEYRLTVVATRDYVIVGAGLLKARFARHWRTVGIRTHRPNQVRKHFAIPVHFFGGAWHRDMAARVLAAVATVRFGR